MLHLQAALLLVVITQAPQVNPLVAVLAVLQVLLVDLLVCSLPSQASLLILIVGSLCKTEQVPVYETVSKTVCWCGADYTYDHAKQHALAGESSQSKVVYEKVLTGYETKQVLTGYKCSCGATK